MNIIDMPLKIRSSRIKRSQSCRYKRLAAKVQTPPTTNAYRSFMEDRIVVNVYDDMRTITLRLNRVDAAAS